MWLRDYDLDIECIRLHSYKLGEKTLLDIQKDRSITRSRRLSSAVAKEGGGSSRGASRRRLDSL